MDENNTVKFPDVVANDAEDIRKEQTDPVEKDENTDAADESTDMIVDPNDPLKSIDKIKDLLKQVEFMLQTMHGQWMASARELQLTDPHMKELEKWNSDHRTKMPEGLSEEEQGKWDHLNGIDSITEEEVERIFGPRPHPIYGVDHAQTVDRIKAACQDFFGYLSIMREYRNIHDAYLQLLELEEEKNLEVLRQKASEETDPDKKAKMEKSIELYYNRKFLDFLADPIDEKDRDRILKALKDEQKIQYWIKRSRDKLEQMKISAKIILEISQFEKRKMEPKYHKNSNVLLLYFLYICAYANVYEAQNDARIKTTCMVMALDAIIRDTWTEERQTRVMNNIKALEDQFLPYIKEPEESGEITPPISGPDAHIALGDVVPSNEVSMDEDQ